MPAAEVTRSRCPSVPRLLLALVLVLGLSGCGGGGGGDGAAAEPLRFGPVTPARITSQVPQGAAPASVELSSTVSGDVTRLQGRTIYVRLQDSAGLYAPTAIVSYDESTRRARLLVSGVVQNTTGTRNGQLSIEVCEDLACQRPLTTAPLTVDVSVTVTAGMRLTQQAVNVSAPFGSLPPPLLLGVTTPEGTAPEDFRFSFLPPTSGSPERGFDASASNDPANPGVVVTPRLLLEGRYEAVLSIESTANPGRDNLFNYRSEVPMALEVTPSGASFAVLPATVAVEIPAGDRQVRIVQVATVARQGFFLMTAITYDSARDPTAAVGSPVLGQWLRAEGGNYAVGACINDDCLPPGSYHSSLRFERFGDDGFATGQTVLVPVTMTVR